MTTFLLGTVLYLFIDVGGNWHLNFTITFVDCSVCNNYSIYHNSNELMKNMTRNK